MMDTATAARAIAGTLSGPNVSFDRVTTDSRSLQAGDLFVALKGERFDGHDFVAQALRDGAVAAVVSVDRAGALAGHADGSLLADLGEEGLELLRTARGLLHGSRSAAAPPSRRRDPHNSNRRNRSPRENAPAPAISSWRAAGFWRAWSRGF